MNQGWINLTSKKLTNVHLIVILIAILTAHTYWHTWEGNTCRDVISHALRHAHIYPVATQKSVPDLCVHQLATMQVRMHVHTGIKIPHYIAIDTYN